MKKYPNSRKTQKQTIPKVDNYQRDNEPNMNKDGQDWERLKRIAFLGRAASCTYQ